MRILIVDDDEISLEMMASGLARDPEFEVETAMDGEQALERVLQGGVSILLSDWMMPGMSGPDLCRRIRSLDLEDYVYFVLVTCRERVEDVVEGLSSGADEFIPKPVHPVELSARIHSIQRLKVLHDQINSKNRQLEANQRLKDAWVNMLVHDVRTPMSAVLGYSEILLQDELPARQERKLTTIRSEALRMNELLEQMLVFTRSEKNRLKPERVATDVLSLLRKARENVLMVARERQVSVDLETTPGSEYRAEVDPLLLSRMFDNLLANAVRFSPQGSAVTVHIRAEGPEIGVTVVDQGPGVPAAAREGLFDGLDRLKGGAMRKALGMAFCRLVAEAHGGHLSYVSNGSHGSGFAVRLPVSVVVTAQAAG